MTVTVDSFAGAPEGVLTDRYALADVPIEFFVSVPKAMFDEISQMRSYSQLNTERLLSEADYALMADVLAPAGFSVGGDFGTSLILDAIATNVGTHSVSPFGAYAAYATLETSIGTPAAYGAAPEASEFVYPGTTQVNGSVFNRLQSGRPYKAYAGFRPMADAPDTTVFIDNLAVSGYLQATARFAFDGGAAAGTRSHFLGFLKRSAMGKLAADMVPSDVVLGFLIQGAIARLIINGTVEWSRADFPVGDNMLDAYLSAGAAFDRSPATIPAASFDSIYLEFFDCYVASDLADYGSITGFSGMRTVSFAGSVMASVNDLDLTGATYGGPYKARYDSSLSVYDSWGGEGAFGAFYEGGPAPLFWTSLVQTMEVV